MELLYWGQERWLCLKGNVSSVSDTSFSAKFTLSNKRPAQYSSHNELTNYTQPN